MEAEDRLHLQESFSSGGQMINEGWDYLCIIGVWGWILSGVGFILKAFPIRDAFKGKSALFWGGCFVFFYVLWLVGMIRA